MVLELLAAICLVKGGHEIILNAFDNFKEEMLEKKRFQTMMTYFKHYKEFQIEFMIACMQFINIVVHSVSEMNFRVALQWEFAALGLGDYLEDHLKFNESEELALQIKAYLDNQVDVANLLEEKEQKDWLEIKIDELEDTLSKEREERDGFEVRQHNCYSILHACANILLTSAFGELLILYTVFWTKVCHKT